MQRTRTQDKTVARFLHADEYVGNNPPVHSLWELSNAGSWRQMTDTVSNGWNKLAKGRSCIVNSMSLSVLERDLTDGSLVYSDPSGAGYTCAWSGDLAALVEPFCPQEIPLWPYRQQMSDLALTKAYARVDAAPILSGEILSDIGKTVGMLRRPFSNATKLLTKMVKRRKVLLKTLEVPRANSQTWLEYRYGWKPILSDADTAFTLAHQCLRTMSRRFLVARGQENAQFSTTRSFSDHPSAAPISAFTCTGSYTVSHEVRACAGVIYSVQNRTPVQAVEAILGTRAQDVPRTAWEMIPFSFVADWFGNVGNWLQAITPNPDVTLQGSWVTMVDKSSVNLHGGTISYGPWGTPPTMHVGSYGSSVRKWTLVERTKDPACPATPTATLRPLSWVQQVDAMALLLKPIISVIKSFRH